MPNTEEKIGIPRDADTALRHLVSETIRRCRKSREEIAEELTARLRQPVTVHMLNDFTSEAKKPARFPACFIASFCEVTNSDALQLSVLSDYQRRLLKLGESTLDALHKRKK